MSSIEPEKIELEKVETDKVETEEPKAAPKRIQKMNILSDDNVDVDITPKVGRNNVIVNLCSCSVTFSSLL